VASFELKGRVAPCTLFRPLIADLDVLAGDVAARLAETPRFFRDLTVIIDLSSLPDDGAGVDLAGLAELLRSHGLTLLGIQGGSEASERVATGMQLPVIPQGRGTGPRPEPDVPAGGGAAGGAMIVDRPVRSGQQVYAKGRDLVVLAPVGQGAEVIADGHIHIYAPLRGRALAGASGFDGARILCRELRAELISVAGLYRVSEDLPANFTGASVQVRLDGSRLVIEPL
jgi:septum site-determining protein MinC